MHETARNVLEHDEVTKLRVWPPTVVGGGGGVRAAASARTPSCVNPHRDAFN
jgi:hypothetical protein